MVAAYLIAINLVAFVFYVYDKLISQVRDWLYLERVPLRVPDDVLKWRLALPGRIVRATVAMVPA